jgi:sugar O-acyltransferase (sialic acid O-acetyltransferase NeuD family)
MIIIGARGFAKELLEEVLLLNQMEKIVFFDNVNQDNPDVLYSRYKVIKSIEEVKNEINNNDKRFVLGLGNPYKRKKMSELFISIGGILTSIISPNSFLGKHDVVIGDGTTIMGGAKVSNGTKIGTCCLIYFNSVITHDNIVGDYVELSPGCKILGRSKIGDFTQIGTNATILPDISIGKNVVVAAGSVVLEDLPDNCMAAGIPAKIKKWLK